MRQVSLLPLASNRPAHADAGAGAAIWTRRQARAGGQERWADKDVCPILRVLIMLRPSND